MADALPLHLRREVSQYDISRWVDPEPLSDIMRQRPSVIDGHRIAAPERMLFH